MSTRKVLDEQGRMVFQKLNGREVNLSYFPNGQVETKRVLFGETETYQEFDFRGRILKNVKKINNEAVIDLDYIYHMFHGIWFCKCYGRYNDRHIVLNRKEGMM